MKSIIDKLKKIAGEIPDKWMQLSQATRIITAGVVLVLIISAIVIPIVSGDDDDSQPTTVSPAPTATVTPLPTQEPVPTATPVPTLTPSPTPDIHEGQVRSELSGEWQEDTGIRKRPYAIMFNNLDIASPQSGLGEAKIVYEALVEAGITRLMGLFEDLDESSSLKDRIGSVRSARHYYCSFADEYDAIFIHFGETKYATKKMKELKLDHIEGTDGIGNTVFYRDKSIKAPHNAFASLEGIEKGIEKLNIRTEHEEDFEPHFNFYEEDTGLSSGNDISTLFLPYSSYMTPFFTYDEETGLYTRHQFDEVHVDYNTNEPLTFKNIIIQLVEEWNIDKNGYQTMDLEDSKGNGYYITNGKLIPITWSKNEKDRFMRYYDSDGKELTINTGKTFISVFPNHRLEKLNLGLNEN